MAIESDDEAPKTGRARVTRIEIERLRGIRHGVLDGLAPLTVLVGQNGSGKSTVLDALLLGAGAGGAADLRRVVERRRHIRVAAPWLLWRSGREGAARVHTAPSSGDGRELSVALIERSGGPSLSVHWTIGPAAPADAPPTFVDDSQSFVYRPGERDLLGRAPPPLPDTLGDVQLIEPAMGGDLHLLLTAATRSGGRRAIEKLLSGVVDGLLAVQMLVDSAGEPEVHFEFEWGSVPIAVAGDGLHALARLAFRIAAPADALLLIEEPEVHMHPRALRASARAMVESMRSGNQLVISTHSLDLVDHLLDAADETGSLGDVAVVRTLIVDGALRTSRFPGDEARFAREQIAEDLR